MSTINMGRQGNLNGNSPENEGVDVIASTAKTKAWVHKGVQQQREYYSQNRVDGDGEGGGSSESGGCQKNR